MQYQKAGDRGGVAALVAKIIWFRRKQEERRVPPWRPGVATPVLKYVMCEVKHPNWLA